MKPLRGREAFNKCIQLAYRDGEEIWLKAAHNSFFVGNIAQSGKYVIWGTVETGINRQKAKKYKDAYKHLSALAREMDGGVFFIPGKPERYPLKEYCHASDLLSAEMDEGSAEEQWQRVKWFTEISGLQPAFIISSGGKSIHCHWKLNKAVDIATRTHLQRLLAIALLSDPAVANPHQPMRIPGFYRKEKGKEQTLEAWSNDKYSLEQIWQGFGNVYSALGCSLHVSFSDERWRRLRRILVEKSSEHKREDLTLTLRMSEEQINPPRQQSQSHHKFNYLGERIPLEICITRDDQNLIDSGREQGDRDNAGFKLARNLIATANTLSSMGIAYDGTPRQLFEDYCCHCSPPLSSPDIERIWRSASQGNARPSLSEEQIQKRISWWQWQNHPHPHKSAGQPTIKKQQWEQQFKIPQQFEEISNSIKSFFNRPAGKLWKRTGELLKNPQLHPKQQEQEQLKQSSAIVLYRPEVIPYEQGKLLSKEEWLAIGSPMIEFEKGDRLEVLKELYLNNEKVFVKESSITGQGKSHDAGLLTSELLTHVGDKLNFETGQIESIEIKPKVFYNDNHHRNPSTQTVENNFADQVSRHDGLKYNKDRTTPSGHWHQVRLKEGDKSEIPGNCPETKTFLLLNQEKNLLVRGGKGSLICEQCPNFKNNQGEIACKFLTERRETLKYKNNIRQHIEQGISSKSGDDVSIIEEVSTLALVRKISVSTKDLAHAYQELKFKDSRLARIIEPIFESLYKIATNLDEMPEYGFDFLAILEQLPKPQEACSYLRSWDEENKQVKKLSAAEFLNERLWEVYSDDWFKVDDIWNLPSLTDLPDLINKHLYNNPAQLFNPQQSPEEKQAIIRDKLPVNCISPVLEAIAFNKAYLSVDKNGLHITKFNKRYPKMLSTYRMVVAMDSTCSKADLAQKLRIKQSEIVEIRQKQPDFSNLTVNIIKGVGSGSKKRREEGDFSIQQRLNIVVEHIFKQQPDQIAGIIDHQDYAHGYLGLDLAETESLKTGYWGNDNRGTNAFEDCRVLIQIGEPIPNLGQMAAEWHALTGEIVDSVKWTGRYGKWLRRRITAESLQCIGRLRAQNRPDPHTIYIVCNDRIDTEEICKHYPGVTINEIEDVYQFCPKAAPKGVQRERGLIEVIWNQISSGSNPTTKDVAAQLGVSRTRVSQIVGNILKPRGIVKDCFSYLKGVLILLIESLKAKLTPPGELSDEERWIAQTYLPSILQDFEQSPPAQVDQAQQQVVGEIVAIAKVYGWKQFEKIVQVAETETICRLVGCILAVLAPGLDLRRRQSEEAIAS
jgi:hypothetical protein